MDNDQLKRVLDENTALISKISSWTREGMRAHYVPMSASQRSIRHAAPIEFLHSGYEVNTVTNTVQRRADKLRPGDEDDSGSSMTSDESDDEALDEVPGISDAASRVKAEESSNFDSVDPADIKKQLDDEERTDLTSRGGYDARTLADDGVDEEDPLGLQAQFPAVTPNDYTWKARRSNSERARRNRAEGNQ